MSKNSKGLVFLGSLQFPENERGILWYQGFFKGPIFVSVPDRTPSISRVHTCKPFFFREGASLLAVELRPEIEGICQDLLLSCEAGVRLRKKKENTNFLSCNCCWMYSTLQKWAITTLYYSFNPILNKNLRCIAWPRNASNRHVLLLLGILHSTLHPLITQKKPEFSLFFWVNTNFTQTQNTCVFNWAITNCLLFCIRESDNMGQKHELHSVGKSLKNV